ncbi:hypothetical protein [Spirillospora albida]|uniref:hypothetical protein n=1 Tax=Spirillospora albida TaxID=58123 RepID=UPI0012FA94F6|nr:hypothetical protein [Spirillospora albida]
MTEPVVSPRDRRVLEALLVAVVVPALLAFHWVDESRNVRRHLEPPEKATVVAKNGIGRLSGVRWRVLERRTAPPLKGPSGPDVTELRIAMVLRPEDAAGAKTAAYGVEYRLVDGAGRYWSADGLVSGTPRANTVSRLTVRGTVPRAKVEAVSLEVRPRPGTRPKGTLPLLRFAL